METECVEAALLSPYSSLLDPTQVHAEISPVDSPKRLESRLEGPPRAHFSSRPHLDSFFLTSTASGLRPLSYRRRLPASRSPPVLSSPFPRSRQQFRSDDIEHHNQSLIATLLHLGSLGN